MPRRRGSLSGFGSTLFFLGNTAMAGPILPELPLPEDKWNEIAQKLELSPQHRRIAEYILKNQCDKQIMSWLKISKSTLRTHLDRIFLRCQVGDRLELVLFICAASHGRVGIRTDGI